MDRFTIGDRVICVKTDSLPGNDVAPPLEIDTDYEVQGITEDSKGNQHLDVGLTSTLSYIRSYETKEHLPDGDTIHWCHPSRFIHKK